MATLVLEATWVGLVSFFVVIRSLGIVYSPDLTT